MKRRTFLFALTAALMAPFARAQSKPLKIGIIGSGRIGSTFGGLWAKAGHEIMFSDRDAEQAKRAAETLGARARAGTVEEAVAFGDAVLIAVPYGAAISTASPNATASSTVPARARAPIDSAARFAFSGSRSENMISCPALAHRPPKVEPMRPEPMMPIFSGFDCARANGAIKAAVSAKRKVRRFMASPSAQAITAKIDSWTRAGERSSPPAWARMQAAFFRKE